MVKAKLTGQRQEKKGQKKKSSIQNRVEKGKYMETTRGKNYLDKVTLHDKLAEIKGKIKNEIYKEGQVNETQVTLIRAGQTIAMEKNSEKSKTDTRSEDEELRKL